eukprot:TRINITY_DN63502_c0_g1_i2.p1 TRINITY_DN63502_c0_g1~~TRINITY_DN63502_c0_g1_i2.p1  ORF type:complete len:121 (-),score=11.05 TRINITY_DN63502_c0_g1_i2:196-558(-)
MGATASSNYQSVGDTSFPKLFIQDPHGDGNGESATVRVTKTNWRGAPIVVDCDSIADAHVAMICFNNGRSSYRPPQPRGGFPPTRSNRIRRFNVTRANGSYTRDCYMEGNRITAVNSWPH